MFGLFLLTPLYAQDSSEGTKMWFEENDGSPSIIVYKTIVNNGTLTDNADGTGSLSGGSVSDTVYGAGWNGDTTTAPSKNAVYDKIETLSDAATAFGGDVTGTIGATVVGDDSHAHTTTTISGVDISSDTNLAGDTENVLTGDVLSIGTGITRDTEWDTSSEIASVVSDETGSGALVFSTSPVLITPALGTPSALVLTNATGLPAASVLAGTFGTGAYVMDTTLTVPTILGGITTTSDLNLKTTSGIGAAGADMHFLVGNNGANEAMTILNNGNVGIGDTTPDALLDVAGTLIADTSVDITGASGARSLYIRTGGIASFYDSAGAEQGRIQGINTPKLSINTFTALELDGNTTITGLLTQTGAGNNSFVGNVGIGTTSPTAKLTVSGGGIAQLLQLIGRTSDGASDFQMMSADSATTYAIFSATSTGLGIGAGSTAPDVTILNSGNVGIGQTVPATPLSLAQDTGILSWGNNDGSTQRASILGTSANTLTFSILNSEKMVINSSGNVGIGTAAPGAKLHIGGDNARQLSIDKSTVAVTAPGAGVGMLRWEAGTNAGTLKLVAYAGTSTTGTTVVDNVGAGN